MVLRNNIYAIMLTCQLCCMACKHEPYITQQPDNGYPADISSIITNNCALSGCHNNLSYAGAGGLNLTTWNKLFDGGNTGAVVIPFRPDFSTLCYYTNTDTGLGVTLVPTMPVNMTPLSKMDYLKLSDWVAKGAPSDKGLIKFTGDPERSKMYVTNKLCDVVTVFDTKTLLQMRYIDVGEKAADEFPHKVLVAPDKKHWYVSFFITSNIIQKFNSVDDRYVGAIHLGPGSWTSFCISDDSKYGYFISNKKEGKLAIADLEQMQLIASYDFNSALYYPSGCCINNELNKLYIGNSIGNYIYAIDLSDKSNPGLNKIVLNNGDKPMNNSSIDPSEMIIDEANNRCYIACVHSGEVRVVDMISDSVIAAVSLGSNPAFMALSKTHHQLLVTCPDDETTFPGERGAVVIIDINTNQVIKKVYSGYQPYGIVVDEKRGIAAVINANLSSEGDEPHHSSDCEGRNGYVSFIDLNSLEEIPGERSEVAVFPFSISAR